MTPLERERWMWAAAAAGIRGTRLTVLWALAMRVDDSGQIKATHAQLAADVGASIRTAKRATRDARNLKVLEQTRAGRWTGAGRGQPSEWALLGFSGGHGDPFTGGSEGHGDPVRTAQGATVTRREVSGGQGGTLPGGSEGHGDPVRSAQGATVAPGEASGGHGGTPSSAEELASSARSTTGWTDSPAEAVRLFLDASVEEAVEVAERVRLVEKPQRLVGYIRYLGKERPEHLRRFLAELRSERAAAADILAGGAPAHPYADDGLGSCAMCGLPQANRAHRKTG